MPSDFGSREMEVEENSPRRMELDGLSNRVIDCAIEVHRKLSSGLSESTYERCL